MRGLLLLVALASCDRVFGLGDPYEDARAPADIGRSGDGSDMGTIDASDSAQLLVRFKFEGNLNEETGRAAANCFSCSYVPSHSQADTLAVRFDGTACMQFAMPDHPTSVSIAMWVLADTGATKPLLVRPYSANQPAPTSWRIDEDNDSIGVTTFDGNSPDLASAGGTNAFVAGVWHHLAVVATPTVRLIYIDGQPQSTAGGMAPIAYQDGNTVSIGCEASGSGEFSGDMDELRIYSGALTKNDVSLLAQ